MLALAMQTLRARKSAFAGALVALLCAAALVTACGALLDTGLRGRIPTERYAGTAVLVTADQELHWSEAKKGKTKSKPLTERARLDARTADRLTGIPGVRAVVPELTFPAQLLGPGGRALGGDSLGHGWASAPLTPFALREGRAPAAADEVVLDAALARGAAAAVGATVTVQSTDAPKAYRVVGIAAPQGADALARQSALFFAEPEARRLAGHPGEVAVIGLLTEPGADLAAVRSRAAAALTGTTAKVRAGEERGPVEFLGADKARAGLVSLGAALGGTSLLVAMLVVVGTFALSIQQRSRELAMLRAIGATPRQLRRMVGREALAVGLLAAVPGAFAGLALARWMYGRFVAVGAVPNTLELTLSAFPPCAAVLTTLLAAWAAARVSARRPSRIRPTEALAEAATGTPRPRVARLLAGVLFLLGHVVLLVVLRGLKTEAASTPVTYLTVVIAAVAVSLLGPLTTRAAAAVLGLVTRVLSPAAGFLAASNTRANAQRLAAVVTPLSLAVAMTSTILFTQTTADHAAREQAVAGTRAGSVLAAAGPGVPAAAAEAVRAVPGVDGVTEVLRTSVRAGQDKFSAQAVDPRGLARTLDLDVTDGSLDAMAEDTVAVSRLAADTRGVSVGDPLTVTLGDGSPVTLKVVAVYGRGLGFGDLTLPRRVVAAHADNPLSGSVLVHGTAGAEALRAAVRPYAAVRVLDRDQVDAARQAQSTTRAQVNLVAMGLIIAFTGIAVVNTLVMATAARRPEFELLRMVGTTRRQVRAMLRWETLTVVVLAAALGTAVATLTLGAYASGMTGSTPYAPPLTYLGILAAAATLAFASTRAATR